MSRFIEREAKKHKDDSDTAKAGVAKLLITASEQYRKVFGEISLPENKHQKLPEAYKPSASDIDLAAESLEQGQIYVSLGFHTELGLTEEEYLESLPKFEEQPENFRGRFNIPVIVETRISPQRQAELAKLNYYIGGLSVTDWDKDPEKYKTPDKPYATWMQDGKQNLNKSVENVRKAFARDERGATIYDGTALFIARPEILKDHYIDLPGTQVGSGSAPCLDLWHGGPMVSDYFVGRAGPRFGSASCGRV